MKVEFRFNGSNQIILIPESSKEKQLLYLVLEETKEFKVFPTTNDATILEGQKGE